MTGAGLESVGMLADLEVTYESRSVEVHAVRGVDIRIGRGEILGLVGESGSGKTVLGLSLLGLLPGRRRRDRGIGDGARRRHGRRAEPRSGGLRRHRWGRCSRTR